MQLSTPSGTSGDLSLDEIRRVLQPSIERFVAYMRDNRLTLCPFVAKCDGKLGVDDGPSVAIALHAELLESLGYTVVNHSVWFEQGQSTTKPHKPVTKTCCSLLVRAPVLHRAS